MRVHPSHLLYPSPDVNEAAPCLALATLASFSPDAGFWLFVAGVLAGVIGLTAWLIGRFRRAPVREVPDARESGRQPAKRPASRA